MRQNKGHSGRRGPTLRGKVTEFSRSSRMRLAFVASNTDVEFNKMITLTYPKVYPRDGKEVKSHLKSFMKRLRRRYGNFSYLWFLEFQMRGAPHFHILVRLAERVQYEWVEQSWCEVIGTKNIGAATRTEALRNHDARYACKYALKMYQKRVPEDYQDVGRLWGHSKDVKPKDGVEVEMSDEEIIVAAGGERWVRDVVTSGYKITFGVGELLKDSISS